MPRQARVLVLIAGLSIAVLGLLGGSIGVAVSILADDADLLAMITFSVSTMILTVGLGMILAWQAWRTIKGYPSTTFQPRCIWLLALLFPLAVLMGLLVLSPNQSVPSGVTTTRLIVHQMVGGNEIRPQDVRNNLAFLESERGFLDGVAMNVAGVSAAIMRNTPISENVVRQALAPVANLSSPSLRHNFVAVFNDKPADPFDDWSGCIENWRTLARVIRDVGLTGVLFDNEEYFTAWSNYPDHCNYPAKSLAEYEAQVRLRGRQIMQAMVSEYPEITIIVLHGPSVSERAAPYPPFPQWQAYHELKGPFFVGLVEGRGGTGLVVDGGEVYGLRSAADFATAYQFQKYDIASAEVDCSFIPDAMRPSWPEEISVSYGIYNRPWHGLPMNAQIYGSTTLNGLRQADDYIWLYLEGMDLIHPGGIGQDWVEALRHVKTTYTGVPLARVLNTGTGAGGAGFAFVDGLLNTSGNPETWAPVVPLQVGATLHRNDDGATQN